METYNFISKAFEELNNSTSEQVKLKANQIGLIVPKTSYSDLNNYFVFDLLGIFKEVINSQNKNWVNVLPVEERRPVFVREVNKGFVSEALSFFNNCSYA
ncbi:MAG: hypothetical protein A3D31_14350 [Candidatus Fluviicola riflensis]|nr:MAG: hypothetical protein CHH17_18785 [Candidatus Fluviicola riflensis]OGS78152.1 MAG: hypothetical protein A3D31_14350 [Candidatus Fluviicola riflensis]OGS85218.1 MAG: hypothetical protein A2724_11285 [Fluviicola sp. RIFCSPHIGHO2_01_FULL_43_53]OGS89489.1 MAG: hypothetical protein A3E30_05590 [Fluviicola sp. RIFCSPHIGHO2_12_FULL_43_24]